MDQLPAPLAPFDCDLSDFPFMPLGVAQLRRSKAWLVCKRRPELAFYMMNLWTASWHETPAGSLENDDDVLADVAMCPPKDWPKLKADVLRGWTLCSDDRLYHRIVVGKALEAWQSRLEHMYNKERDRLRKANKERREEHKPILPVPDFDEWNFARLAKLSAGNPPRSGGTTPEIQNTAAGTPAENALKGEGEGEGEGEGHLSGTSAGNFPLESGKPPSPPLPRSLTLEEAQQLQATYPPGTYRQSEWLIVERLANFHLTAGVPFEVMLDSCQRYRAQCAARDSIGTQYVFSPVKHFDRDMPQFNDPFPLPRTKAEARQDSDADAVETWLARRREAT